MMIGKIVIKITMRNYIFQCVMDFAMMMIMMWRWNLTAGFRRVREALVTLHQKALVHFKGSRAAHIKEPQ